MTPATLQSFADANDRAAATTKKLEKQKILGDYLRSIEADDDVRRAVRYAGGYAFATTDERVLGVSGSIVSAAVLALVPMDGGAYHDLVVRSGEIGEALATMWATQPPPVDAEANPLTLADLSDTFDALAKTGAQETKRKLVGHLLQRCRTPRQAAYAAKIISGDLRTGVQEGVLQAAVAQAFDKPLAAIQRAQLLVGDLDEVAILARRGELQHAAFKLFHPIQFMLATPQEAPADAVATMAARSFFAEDKLDGIRAQVHKQGDRIEIYTRTMDRIDASFPDVVRILAGLPGDLLLDGEIVPYRDGQVLPFASIQKRLGRKQLTGNILRDYPCVFMAFDLLYLNGELLMDRPLRQRRAQLDVLPITQTAASELTALEQIEAAFAAARANRNEGLILKDPDSLYAPGRRGKAWLKLKTHLPTLDCVVTAAEYGHGKRRNSLSDYTFAVWDREPTAEGAKLVNIGKAFSGVTDEEIARLTELFLGIAVQKFGRVYQVKPQVVMEIAADQIQISARHASGYALRFPRIKRLRWDKCPSDADRLARVVELYESTHNFGRSDQPEPVREATLFDGLV